MCMLSCMSTGIANERYTLVTDDWAHGIRRSLVFFLLNNHNAEGISRSCHLAQPHFTAAYIVSINLIYLSYTQQNRTCFHAIIKHGLKKMRINLFGILWEYTRKRSYDIRSEKKCPVKRSICIKVNIGKIGILHIALSHTPKNVFINFIMLEHILSV